MHGVAGVGKTEFGSRLAEILGTRFIDLPQYIKQRRLYIGYDRKARAYLIDLRAVSAAIGSELRRERGVVASVYLFKPRRITVRVATVLRLRPDILLQVLESRGYPPEKIAENLSAELVDQPLHQALKKYGRRKTVQLDVTERDLRAMASEFASAFLGSRVKKLHREVDWTSKLERAGRLEEVLGFIARHG